MNKIKLLWNKLSHLGLREEEGVFGHREVILLNKILLIAPFVVIAILPFEIYYNGFVTLPLELALIGLMIVPLILHYYRWFYIARLYSYLISNAFILVAGVLVGKNIYNHIAFVPIMLFGIFLFKTTRDRIIVFFISLFFFLTLEYLRELIPPAVDIAPEIKVKFSFIFYLMCLLLTFMLGFYFVNINNEYEKQIIEQKENISFKNKEITASITYAKRIQQAKLPVVDEIKKSLPNSFVLFKPKDIVSGDFYFFHKNKNTVYIAAADCTGHGVPGALMSMVSSEQLNDAVKNHTEVSEILIFVNKGIKKSLRQNNTEDATRDGMDIALCSVNESTLNYAGANRPLWLIRKNSHKVEEIKATKKAIGGFTEDAQIYEGHTFTVNKGDRFYLFTDGYADQFGGQEGKKLMTKKFKEILLQIQNTPMQEQESFLLTFIEKWQSGTEQVDDILVIGVEI